MKLKNDLDIIVEKIKYINPIAIILYGSYGRGEGAWYNDKFGLKQPYNDYDILIILKSLISKIELKRIKESLLEEINIKWIDLSQKTENNIKNLNSSIFNYDLKYASKVIYGDTKILELIPKIESSKLSLEEGNLLFKTRMWTFLGSLKKSGFSAEYDEKECQFFKYQMAKALLAVIDVLLLQKGQYVSSYKMRIDIFKKLYPDKKKQYQIFDWALKEKLNPKLSKMNVTDMKNLYLSVYNIYMKEMLKLLSKYYSSRMNNPEKLIYFWSYSFKTVLKRIAYIVIFRNINFEKKILLEKAQLYILLSLNKNKNRNNYLRKVNLILKQLDNSIPTNLSLDECRVLISKIRLN